MFSYWIDHDKHSEASCKANKPFFHEEFRLLNMLKVKFKLQILSVPQHNG